MFFASPVNTLEPYVGILDRPSCDVFLAPEPKPEIGEHILLQRKMDVLSLPPTDHWLAGGDVPRYPYAKIWDESANGPLVVLHSSRTTGIPKVLYVKHETYSAVEDFKRIPSTKDEPGQTAQQWLHKRVFTSNPWFHASGSPFVLNMAIHHDFVPVIVPPSTLLRLDPRTVENAHTYGDVQASCMILSVINELKQDPAHPNALSGLESVSFAGVSVPPDVGEKFAKLTRMTPPPCSTLPSMAFCLQRCQIGRLGNTISLTTCSVMSSSTSRPTCMR